MRVDGGVADVADLIQAREILTESWPAERGPRHRDALETVLKVIDGHRSTQDAETALRDAASEAGILAN
nr:DUF982 domain-containing protein [Pseudaminobacter soli]